MKNNLHDLFINPPKEYGEVAFYWWLGDKLTKERLLWQLDRLQDMDICGLQVNYAHTDKGGNSHGLTYKSDPPLFSEDWWSLFHWFMSEAKKRGMAVSLSDYTLGTPGQGWYVDEVLNKYPESCGATLFREKLTLSHGQNFKYKISNTLLSVIAYRVDSGNLVFESQVDLLQYVEKGFVNYEVPEGEWSIIVVGYSKKIDSMDPMNPMTGKGVIEFFFQRFEEQNPGEGGKGLNYFFSDELNFNIRGNLWNDAFAEEFISRKGYDIIPLLPALFDDIGPITQKVRLDYYDVIVLLEELAYFKPVYDWHEERGMTYGCDHGGRGRDVTEFGDYFRTMKWNQGPGNDQPNLTSDIIKSKVSSSVSHMNKRPRTWLEGFYGSGWGTSSEQVADATFRNFALGHNLLTLHGLYYSTHGGHWEWAPPCNHFRMPYWKQMKNFLRCTKRLSYLMSQGIHVADVAIMYPVAAVEGGIDGNKSVETAFDVGEYLYKNGIDFDFIDFESIQKAEVADKQLKIAGESFKVLVIPSMQTIRFSAMEKALEFSRKGGIVICIGELPKASDRAGRNDKVLDSMIQEIFFRNDTGYVVTSNEQIKSIIDNSMVRDIILSKDLESFPYYLHRRIDDLDVYMVYGVPKNSECFFRSKGNVQIWNPWTAEIFKLTDTSENENGTRVMMPYEKDEIQLIVFSKTECDATLFKQLNVFSEIHLKDEWEFELKPTLDNTWGDFRLPAYSGYISAEMRQPLYKYEEKEWSKITLGYGPEFMKLGPLSEQEDLPCIEQYLLNSELDALERYDIKPYEYSDRFGVEGDPGHQGWHGLKGQITDDYIVLGKPVENTTEITYCPEEKGNVYYMWTTVSSESIEKAMILTGKIKPERLWINGIECTDEKVELVQGSNVIVLKYSNVGRTYFLLKRDNNALWEQTYPLSMEWYQDPSIYKFDIFPCGKNNIGKYLFTSPPALKAMTIHAYGDTQVSINGENAELELIDRKPDGLNKYIAKVSTIIKGCSEVNIKIQHQNGYYGGAAIPVPIEFECGKGFIKTGNWSEYQGLYSYSGGACYSQNISLTKLELQQKIILNLGDVISSTKVFLNGKLVGEKCAPSWKFDITNYAIEGENNLEVYVYNTLANHYTTIPTRYRGSLKSGLIGPVTLQICR